MAVSLVPKGGQRLELCMVPGCLTFTPRPVCYFHAKPPAEPMKTCLRCYESQPLSAFAWKGRCRICDDCRWTAPMTHEESLVRKREYRERNARRIRMAGRQYWRRKTAA